MPIEETQPTDAAASAAGTGNGSGEQAAAGGEQTASTSDYLARIASDPDFAKSEVRKHQSRADQAEAQARAAEAWKALSKWHTDPAEIDRHLQNYLQLVKQQESVEKPKGQESDMASDDDEFLSDEARELRTLKQELVQMREQLGQQSTSIGQQSLTRAYEKVAEEWGLSGERYDRVLGKLIEQVQNLPNSGAAGQAVLDQLRSPETAQKTVDALLRGALTRDDLVELARERVLREDGLREGMRTDGPSTRLPATKDAHADIKSPLEALRAARRNPDLTAGTRA